MNRRKGQQSHTAKSQAEEMAKERASIASTASASRHSTACFSCRSARQKCDRLEPCARCVAQSRPCSYPAMSNRGRKEGSSNKPDTVEKLLLRISQSPVGEEVIQVILNSAAAAAHAKTNLTPKSDTLKNDTIFPSATSTPTLAEQCHLPPTECAKYCTHAAEPKARPEVVSPLDILAAAVTAVSKETNDSASPHGFSPPSFNSSPSSFSLPTTMPQGPFSADGKLVTYLAAQPIPRRDWQVLSEQPVESIFKLEASACDPVASRIIDETDAHFFFNQFFATHNPVLGLLDPELHTPESVYAASFTLFSVICALGCAVSTRPRDKVIYQGLLHLAEGNLQWCIAASVTSLEIIQAILLMYHWAPVRHSRVSDDPSRLHLCHAVQLARLTCINNPNRVGKYIEASGLATDADSAVRLRRNYERCWLCLFNADKTFCGINGPHLCISWDEVPQNAHEWWRQPCATQTDCLVSGIVETRGILFNAIDERKGANETAASVSNWHKRWLHVLEHVRYVRCAPDTLHSSRYLPLLAFHIDHYILMLGAQAVRELLSSDEAADPEALSVMYEKSARVALRIFDAMLNSQSLSPFTRGFHNTQFIMVCHALADVRLSIVKHALPQEDANKAAVAARATASYLNDVVKELPSSSAGRLYARLAQSLFDGVAPFEPPVHAGDETFIAPTPGPEDSWSTDCWLTDGLTGNDVLFADSLDFGHYIFDNIDHMRVADVNSTMDT